MAELSPMMQQYFEIKQAYPDTLLFFRLGDFYEMFFDDAKTASKELDLVLTGRDCGQEERAPMCGVPFHSADSYIAKLVSRGYKVAICEQLEDPKAAKGIVKRGVIRVITAGTVIESSMLDETKNNYLACLCLSFDQMGLCFADVSTGEVHLTAFSENTDEELIRLICSKDMTAIEEWLTCYFQNLLGQVQDKNLVFIRIYSLLGRILKFLYEMNLDTGDLEREIIQVYTRFDSFRTYEQFVKWLTQLCASVCEKMDSSLQNYHNQIYTMALGYIRENFETNTLCLNDIARHANISPAYLSSLFKKVSGQSISDTITALRIESACHYLESTSLSLKEISTKCGYTNQYYFSNSFKKKLGMSPSAYREARGTQGQ